MKISLFQQLYKNIRSPRKSAMFRFLKMGYNIFYAFFLTFIAAILFSPAVVKQTVEASQSLSFIFIPLMLVLYYILLACVVFFFVSILAIIGLLIKTMLKRRLNYQQAWSIAANAITWPTLIYALINLFAPLPSYAFWIYGLVCVAMLMNLIQAVPKPKPRPVRPQQSAAPRN